MSIYLYKIYYLCGNTCGKARKLERDMGRGGGQQRLEHAWGGTGGGGATEAWVQGWRGLKKTDVIEK